MHIRLEEDLRFLFPAVDERLVYERSREVFQIWHARSGHHALNHAEEYQIVCGIDPEPRTRSTVPQV